MTLEQRNMTLKQDFHLAHSLHKDLDFNDCFNIDVEDVVQSLSRHSDDLSRSNAEEFADKLDQFEKLESLSSDSNRNENITYADLYLYPVRNNSWRRGNDEVRSCKDFSVSEMLQFPHVSNTQSQNKFLFDSFYCYSNLHHWYHYPTMTKSYAQGCSPTDARYQHSTVSMFQCLDEPKAASPSLSLATAQVKTSKNDVSIEASGIKKQDVTMKVTSLKQENHEKPCYGHIYYDFSLISEAMILNSKSITGDSIQSILQNDAMNTDAVKLSITKDPNRRQRITFPDKLLEMLSCKNCSELIGWKPHGRAFYIIDVKTFKSEGCNRFFKIQKYRSFERQLNFWDFRRITSGPDKGAYYHPLFLRGKPSLISFMSYVKIRSGNRRKSNPTSEPNFYALAEQRPLPK